MSELYAGEGTDAPEPEVPEAPVLTDGDDFGEPAELEEYEPFEEDLEPSESDDFEEPDEPEPFENSSLAWEGDDFEEPDEPEEPDEASKNASELSRAEGDGEDSDGREQTDAEVPEEPEALGEPEAPDDVPEPEGEPETDEGTADVDALETPEADPEPEPEGPEPDPEPEGPEPEAEPEVALEAPETTEVAATEPEVSTVTDTEATPEAHAEPAGMPYVESSADGTEQPGEPGTEAASETQEAPETSTKIERPDIEHMYKKGADAVEYGEPIKELGVSLFDGEPGREQVAQGRLSDCGIIATIGASASARPDIIKENLKENPDGTYSATIHQAQYDGKGYVPGDRVEMTVTPDLPVHQGSQNASYARVEQVAWPAVLEKTAAGIDETWSEGRGNQWERDWSINKNQMLAANEQLKPEDLEGPTPSGYGRLNQGSRPYDQAELLTQLTGEASEIVAFPQGEGAEQKLEQDIREKLAEGKPVLVATRGADAASGEHELPKNLVDGHVYEVLSFDEGNVTLHNPWNERHPEPLTTAEFMEYYQPQGYPGEYITLR
ncbi:hypothetical protein ACWGI8_07485 [Streptomyces sp. NPDC054841]